MAISNEVVKAIYVGNGSTKQFAIPFDYVQNSAIRVILRDESVIPAVETVQTQGGDYSLVGSPVTDILMVVAPLATEKLVVKRDSAFTQTANFIPTGSFPAETNETALDEAVRQSQENKEDLSRALLLRETTGLSDIELPQPQADLFFKWNATADAIEYAQLVTTTASLATQVEAEAGTSDTTFMSPLKVQQKITSDIATEGEARAGTNDTQMITPLKSKYSIQEFAPNSVKAASNVGLAASVNLSALTVALKIADGSTDPSSTTPVKIGFRNQTLTIGGMVVRGVSAALSLIVPSGATLGTFDGVESNLFVYAIDNDGAVELGICHEILDEGKLHTSSTLNSSSDSNSILYSTTGRTSKAVRLIGKLLATEATAGTWATAPSEVSVMDNASAESSVHSSRATYTLTLSGGGVTKASSPDFDVATWMRDRGDIVIQYSYIHSSATGTAIGSGNYFFSVPSGDSVDITKLAASGNSCVGSCFVFSTATGITYGVTRFDAASGTNIALQSGNDVTSGTVGSGFNSINQAAITYSFTARLPIQGWHC